MISSRRPSVLSPRLTRALALTLTCVVGLGTQGFAQTTEVAPSPARIRDALARPLAHVIFDAGQLDVQQVMVARSGAVQSPAPRASSARSQRLRPPVTGNRSSRARRVAGAVIGVIGGFWLGAEIGAALEGDSCNCDDPGMMGFIVGAPVGAAIGGVLGALLGGK